MNDTPSCTVNQCSPENGPCPAAGTTNKPGAQGAVPNAGMPGSYGVQMPTLNPPAAQVPIAMPWDGNPISGLTPGGVSARTVSPPLRRSEFEQFAEDAAGHPLPVYGRQLFSQVPTTFAPMDRIPVPAHYVLGPGDQLLIRIWGKIDFEATVTIDRNGQIFLPRVGTLSVAGLRYEQIEGYVRSAIANLYKDFELNVTMGQLRSIQIFVLGSARQPGVYTVSSLSTLVNALFASGGPSATGTMRRIQLRRDGQVVTELDLYDLLRRGDKSQDAPLLPGDVIYIPTVGPQVAIYGSVDEPGVYELKGETTVASAMKDTGGLTNLSNADRVLLERIENHRRRHVDEFSLDASGLQRVLQDGDLLQIFPISPRFENAVTLRGNVAQPGRFPWHEGMHVSDLIPSRDVLITRRYWSQQNHLTPPLPVGSPPVAGTSNQPGTQAIDPLDSQRAGQQGNQEISAPLDVMGDLARRSTEINWEYAAIERLDERDLSTHVIAFNLRKAIEDPASSDNQVLQTGDVITIFSRSDLPLPEDKHAAFVRVSGEVNAPGVYRIQPGETLREVVEQAGGLTPHSYPYASLLTRESTRRAQEDQLRISISQMQRELMSRYAAAPSLTPSSSADQQTQLASQQAVIAQLSSLHPTGRVVLDMKPGGNTLADIPDFPLEDGDSYYVPPRLATVQVSGAVYNENAFRYLEKKRLSAYLKQAGGPTRQADVRHIFVIRADGTVVPRQGRGTLWAADSFGNLVLLPGDAIVVPTRLKSPGNFMQQLPFVTSILAQTATTGAVIATTH